MSDENLSEKLNIPVTPEMRAKVENAAWERRMTKADLVRRALDAYLEAPAAGAPVQHQFGSDR